MKNGFWFLSLLVVTFMFNACDKEEDDGNNNNENWAAEVAGTYIGTGTNNSTGSLPATTEFTRTADKSISIQINWDGSTFCIDSAKMNSPTTFSVQNQKELCSQNYFEGSGSFNGNSVSYTGCCLNYGISTTFSGTK